MIEKQLILPTLTDWIDTDGGASVSIENAKITFPKKNEKGRFFAAINAGKHMLGINQRRHALRGHEKMNASPIYRCMKSILRGAKW